jgi:hypothetical protein
MKMDDGGRLLLGASDFGNVDGPVPSVPPFDGREGVRRRSNFVRQS